MNYSNILKYLVPAQAIDTSPALMAHLPVQPLTIPALLLALALPVAAQERAPAPLPASSPFLGGVPAGTLSAEPIAISIADAIRRALEHNLGVLQANDAVDRAQGARWVAMSDLLPDVRGSVADSGRKTNLEAFGFPLGPTFPRVVGPFNLFDARVFVSQRVVDLAARHDARAETHQVSAARHSYRSARDMVVLASASLYLQALAGAARAESARAQLDTAQALYTQAQNLRQSGIVAGLDVVRAEVRLSSDRQRATAAQNDFEKTKLQLARVMGLPIGQSFTLSDQLPTVPVPEMMLEEALERAYRDRPDYLAAQDRVRAAESARRAASAERLPSVHVNADYGLIGLSPGSSLATYTVSGSVEVPLFQGGRTKGRVAEADANLRSRRAEVEDLRAEIYYDVRSAFLDLQATGEQLQATTRGRELAAQQLAQSRDRFAAGVTNNIEVVQAQEAVTVANEQYIGALYGYNVAKALLARSLGTAENAVEKYLGGVK
jgi:outer membrane protein TolC